MGGWPMFGRFVRSLGAILACVAGTGAGWLALVIGDA
jgi:hypothetical protein